MKNEDIVFISRNSNGDWYVGYKVKVQRGIKGKSKSKVDELIIVGIPDSKFEHWCEVNGIYVECDEVKDGLF